MKTRTKVKAGGIRLQNHNETLWSPRTTVSAAGTDSAHKVKNEQIVLRDTPSGMPVKTRIKAGFKYIMKVVY